MEEKSSLRWFLIRNFIVVLITVGIVERLIMELFNRLIFPAVQSYYFANTEWNQSLPTWQIVIIIIAVFVELILLGLKGVVPSVLSSGIQYAIEQIEKAIRVVDPTLSGNKSITQLNGADGFFLILIIVAMIALSIIPYVLAALYYSWLVSHEVEKITERENALHAEYDRKRNLMLSDIAHDLRTPITTVAGYTKAIQDGMVTDPVKQDQYLTAIQAKSKRMTELINLLFEYVKLDSEGFQLDKKPLDIMELLRENAALVYSDVEENEMELEVELPDETCMVYADRVQMSRVVTNLLTNAMRHNPKGTKILITSQEMEDTMKIIIADNGDAIEPQVAEHLFEPFAMGDESRNSKGGSGLGLSIAAKVVKMHGWELVLEGYPGYTKAFVILLNK